MTQIAERLEHPRRAHASRAVDAAPRTSAPVKWWAAVGAAYLVFMVAVLTNWVLGPLFKTVPVGPTPVPTFMKVAVVFFEVISIPAILACFYFMVVKPWRRDGKLSVDGALTIAFATVWFQDPLSAYSGTWFTYNAWALNYGSWENSIPFATGKAAPGAMIVEPLLIVPGAYVYCFVVAMFAGSWVMRTARKRWPQLSAVKLGAICVVAMWIFDVILEGVMFMPLGHLGVPGRPLQHLPEHLSQVPVDRDDHGRFGVRVRCHLALLQK